MKFYKRDPDRALSGMAELTLKQRGGYNSLIDLLYSRDGAVPDDDIRVAKMICCHWREWKVVKDELIALDKVWIEGGMLHARRVLDTLKEASDFSQDQRKRVAVRWDKYKKTKENNEPPIPRGNTSTPIATPIKENIQSAAPQTDGLDFEKFWQDYPREKNMSKKRALMMWKKLSPEDRVQAVGAVSGYRSYCDKNKSWYHTLHAERFLSQERFKGFAAEPQPTPEEIAKSKDWADRYFKRGKYAESYK